MKTTTKPDPDRDSMFAAVYALIATLLTAVVFGVLILMAADW